MVVVINLLFSGYYSVNTGRVRETMRVVYPPLNDLSDLGNYIQQECQDKTTYSLEKSTGICKLLNSFVSDFGSGIDVVGK